MTSIITVRRPDEILLLSDGTGHSRDGKTTIGITKCALVPGAPALVACRGVAALASLFATDAREHSFDDLILHGPEIVRNFTTVLGKSHGLVWTQEEMTIAGWSDREQRLAIYMMSMDDRYAFRGQLPYTWHEIKDDVTMAPPPAPEANYQFPWDREFDPAIDGLAMMEAQRLTPGYADFIGRWVQVARVTADGLVSSQIIRPAAWQRAAEAA